MKQLILIIVIATLTALFTTRVNAEVIFSHTFNYNQATICQKEGRATLCYSTGYSPIQTYRHRHSRMVSMIPMNNNGIQQHNNIHSKSHTHDDSHHTINNVLDTAIKIAVLKKLLDD